MQNIPNLINDADWNWYHGKAKDSTTLSLTCLSLTPLLLYTSDFLSLGSKKKEREARKREDLMTFANNTGQSEGISK